MALTAQELPIVKSILVANKVIEATASDGDVAAAHAAMLSGPNATEYKAQLEAGGVSVGPSWSTILLVVGAAVAGYLIWKNYQSPKQVSSAEYPDPDRLRGMGKALGALGGRRSMGRLGSCRPRGMGQPPSTKYEFEPESRLEGYRRRRPAKSTR